MKIWRMPIACWLPKATNTHSDCVILIAFPLQQWLHESASMLRYTYSACLVNVRADGTCNYHWTLKVTITNIFTGTHILFHADPLPHNPSPLFSHFHYTIYRFPMMSLEFFIDIILPAALWPWG
jgi:hypothetical protein